MRNLQSGTRQIGDKLRDTAVYAVAADARSIAFLNRAVAINSIVRVILRILRIDLRRLSRARALAMYAVQFPLTLDLSYETNGERISVRLSVRGTHCCQNGEHQVTN